jgi:hypothetical protein
MDNHLHRQLLADLDLAGSHGDAAGAETIRRALDGDKDALADYLAWGGIED